LLDVSGVTRLVEVTVSVVARVVGIVCVVVMISGTVFVKVVLLEEATKIAAARIIAATIIATAIPVYVRGGWPFIDILPRPLGA
jgi:hypothetical protein